jgi:hypothetical protein
MPSAQALEQQMAEAMAARSSAETDLARVKGKGSDIQRKVWIPLLKMWRLVEPRWILPWLHINS